MDAVKYRCDTCGDTEGWEEDRRSFSSTPWVDPMGEPWVCARGDCGGWYRAVPDKSTAGSPQNVLRSLPDDAGERKATPITTGVIDYFPLALAEVARLSKAGNDQHNPGQPLHWARGKSGDHADCIVRHLIQRGTIDKDGISHTAKVAWRALALLQEEMEAAAGFTPEAT